MRSPWRALAIAALLAAQAGCSSVGPATVPRDRFDYVAAISDSWKRQMLQNLLKVRYADAPVFMDVTSVINAYSFAGQLDAAAQYAPPDRGDFFYGIGGNVAYADRPTITYAPLSGERFSRSLMTPLPISGVLYLLQSGFPADLTLRVCVSSINGLDNAYGGRGNAHDGELQFAELMAAMRRSQRSRGLGIRQKSPLDRESALLTLRDTDAAAAQANRRIRELLGLDPNAEVFEVVYGAFAIQPGQIALLSRSTLQVMADLASTIDVPDADVAEGRVDEPLRDAEQTRLFPPLMRVRSGETPPPDAYVAVRYRGRSFWIDDRDLQSKSSMSFLMLLFSLAETGSAPGSGAPLVTVPAR